MNNIHYRLVDRKDVEAIVSLIVKLQKQHTEIDSFYGNSITVAELKKYITEELGDPSRFLMCALNDNTVVGFIRGTLRSKPEDRSRGYAILNDLFIEQNYRKKGIASSLILKFKEWIKTHNLYRVELSVDIRNTLGIDFWTKSGFKTYQYKMYLELPEAK